MGQVFVSPFFFFFFCVVESFFFFFSLPAGLRGLQFFPFAFGYVHSCTALNPIKEIPMTVLFRRLFHLCDGTSTSSSMISSSGCHRFSFLSRKIVAGARPHFDDHLLFRRRVFGQPI